LAYTVEEAAALMGLSVRAFRDHVLPRCPKIRVGRSVRIPREAFRHFVETLTETDPVDSARDLVARLRQT
jgi:excisionase family DNA binding protein